MKKIKTLLIAPLSAICLLAVSCSSSSSKIALIFGDKNGTDVTDITYTDLKSKIESKETFILAVEPESACVCWSQFQPILKKYIQDTHVIIYHINYGAFGDKDSFGLNIRKGYSSFAICENGVWKQNLLSESNNIFKSQDAFNNYMSEVVNLPHYFYVNLNDVNNMRSANTESVIYFARNNCGDCTYVDKNVLKQYAQNNVNRKDMYILDCEALGIRQYVDEKKHELTPESKVLWNQFKVTYGLADTENKLYGFGTGYVPTFEVVKSNQYISGCVYFNDSLEKVNNKYVVKSTFYSQGRLSNLQYLQGFNGKSVLEGLEVNETDVEEYGGSYYWNQDAANVYHKPLLEAFLNYYLK